MALAPKAWDYALSIENLWDQMLIAIQDDDRLEALTDVGIDMHEEFLKVVKHARSLKGKTTASALNKALAGIIHAYAVTEPIAREWLFITRWPPSLARRAWGLLWALQMIGARRRDAAIEIIELTPVGGREGTDIIEALEAGRFGVASRLIMKLLNSQWKTLTRGQPEYIRHALDAYHHGET